MAILNTITQINETIESIIADIDFSTSTFSKKMSSGETNTIFANFQTVLNSLYEKARLVQDLREYAESYIENEFNAKYTELGEIVSAVEAADKDYQNKRNKNYEVLFTNNTVSSSTINDFDGTNISPALITTDGYLTIPYDEIKTLIPESTGDAQVISNSSSITEEANYSFPSPQLINYVNVSVPNCDIKSLTFIDKEDTETTMDDISNPFIDIANVAAIRLVVESNDPEEITQDEYSKLTNNGIKTIF